MLGKLKHVLRRATRAAVRVTWAAMPDELKRVIRRAIGSRWKPSGVLAGFYPRFREAGLVDKDWYLIAYPDVARSGIDPVEHYGTSGIRDHRQPNEYFSPSWYMDKYPDVPRAGVNPFIHYVEYGSLERRNPSPAFDTGWYADQIGKEELGDELPLAHYLRVGRFQGLPPADPGRHYRRSLLREAQQLPYEIEEFRRHIDVMVYRPKFIVYIEGDDSDSREMTIKSLRNQVYDRFAVANGVANLLPVETDPPDPKFLIWLRAGDELHKTALYRFASAINAQPKADMFYADEDHLEGGRRFNPFFKPDWSPDYIESFNYIGRAACFRLPLAIEIFKRSAGNYDFVLRFTETAKHIEHLRRVLLHTRYNDVDEKEDVAAIQGRLRRTGRQGVVRAISNGIGAYRSELTWAEKPLISIVIPTAGNVVTVEGRSIDLIVNCVERIAQSDYKNIEFIIVDNGDLSGDQFRTLAQFNCKMATFTEPEFNVAAKLNLGADQAQGEYLLLMNDDIEPLVPVWIDRMLDQFAKPHVGVVGAKLLYPDETTQHVGVVINSGRPDHVRRKMVRDDLGYFFSTCAVRNYSAVTGACMMTRTDVYRKVGGYTEDLAISYNDVDFCLKVRSLGLTAVYTPFAELTHFESQSRDAKLEPSEADYFGDRWGAMAAFDPYYNEEPFDTLPASYRIAMNPRQL
ncbi:MULTISPECIES: glycosyltransferase [unclassified Mesorhizobium]|uniref:glycosyltransferase family 2 protein n=1 Tax=unclassified Mesorhizobium TaxID=325217 RepID=UPI000FCBEBE1|nr:MULTISPECIES: glycosyltransferase [unclassified Mesorhizobium]TGP27246.1 glycosyltransferase [Mesorhizobium sp. M1D.F.Ca.ET.231.01.1.1]TGP39204.1 glycosyltransferase [Mesorhizobium sp. M1D.F.Ca.ET.234.01.1.1]TGS51413.1 glycosyltransferase [Mesorhizobium sp. M1D.F.Ca.ET.184.01.1.1]TGS67297.1 glycosyltransferase [Mesorhizobium sp. M1D.F.Ca.ET.183.01.1.1]